MSKKKFPKGSLLEARQRGGLKTAARIKAEKKALAQEKVADTSLEHEAPEKDNIEVEPSWQQD